MSILDGLTMEAQKKFFIALAGDARIRVIWEKDCAVPHANSNGVIYLSPPNPSEATEWLYDSHHEISHLFPENIWMYDALMKMPKGSKLHHHVANVLMDHLADKSRIGQYEGRDDIMDRGRASQIQSKLMPNFTQIDDKKDPWTALIMSLMIWDTDCRAEWIHSPYMYALDAFTIEQREHYDDYIEMFEEMGLEGQTLSCTKPEEMVKLVQDLIDLTKEMQEEKKKQKQQQGQGKGNGKEKGKDSNSGKSGKEKSTETSSGKGKSKQGKDDRKEVTGKGKDDPNKNKDEKKAQKGKDRRDDIGNDRTAVSQHETPCDVEIPDFALDVYKPMDREKEKKEIPNRYSPSSAKQYIPYEKNSIIEVEENPNPADSAVVDIMDLHSNSTLSKKVKKHMLAVVAKRYQYGLKAGKLHSKNIHRVYTQDRPNMFKKQQAQQLRLDTAFEIVMDCSGSMSGTKYAYAAACSISISEILNQLRIKHEIIGYTESGYLITYIFKHFNEIASPEKLGLRMGNRGMIRMHTNADGESLLWCAERLLKRKESNKVMIVLSDGYPAGSFSGDGHAYLAYIAGLIEKETPINLIGLGIHTDAVAKFYKNHSVINDMHMLNDVMIDALKKSIMK